jgi:hypothetical protein
MQPLTTMPTQPFFSASRPRLPPAQRAAAVDHQHAALPRRFQRGAHQRVVFEHLERGRGAGKGALLAEGAEHRRHHAQGAVGKAVFMRVAQVGGDGLHRWSPDR